MMRATLILIAVVWTLSLAGCGGGDPEASESAAEGGPVGGQAGSTDAAIDSSGAKTEIVRALLATLDEVKGDGEGAKNDLRGILLAADDELATSLGSNSKRLIMRYANKKPAPMIIGGPVNPPGGRLPAQPVKSPAGLKTGSGSSGSGGQPGEPQTLIVRSLLATLNEVEVKNEDQGVKAELRRSLAEADVELRRILGDNSKRLILAANKKPVVPIVGTPAPARAASDDRGPGARPKAGDPGPPQTPIVKTLIDAIEQSDDQDDTGKAALKRSLIEADVELRQVLGGNAKRMITEHANKKPVVRRISEGLPLVESP